MKPVPKKGEEQLVIPMGSDWLYAMAHTPAEIRGGVVVCNSLFEERKSSHRVLVELARELASRGFAVLRFDYRGCGDSSGEFVDFSVGDWHADIAAAAALLKARIGKAPLTLAGVRLGCLMVLDTWKEVGAERVILWEPVMSGVEYLDEEIRKSLIKEMMTCGASRRTGNAVHHDLDHGKTIDFDGFPVTPRLYKDMAMLDAMKSESVTPEHALVVNVTSQDHLSPKMLKLAARLKTHGSEVAAIAVMEPQFWNLSDVLDSRELIERTAKWLESSFNE